MEGNNNAPFSEGQKVIALLPSSRLKIEKGQTVTVGVCFKRECRCKRWSVGLVEAAGMASSDISICCMCGQSYSHPGMNYLMCDYKYFAPIKRTPFEISISKEVLDSLPKETQERSDVVVKPQEASVQNQLLDTIDEMIALLPQIPIEQRFAYADKIVEAIDRTCKLIRGE